MGSHIYDVARQGPGCGAEDEVEGVLGGELEGGDFWGGVGCRVGDGGEAGVVAVEVEGAEGGCGEGEGGPGEGAGCLGCVAELGGGEGM